MLLLGGTVSTAVGTMVATTTSPAVAAAVCRPTARLLCVAPVAHPAAVRLRVGQRLTAAPADPAFGWSPARVVGPSVLVRSGPARSGAPVSFRAVRTGRTTLVSDGTARCTGHQVCPALAVAWTITVVVSR
jgi:hypothetical protein